METTAMVEPKPKNSDLTSNVVKLGVSLGLLFATVYLIGTAWKKSQK